MSELSASEHLRLDGPLTPRDISKRIHLSTGATTGMLDRLEQRGFVRRAPHPTDRRSVLVYYQERDNPSIARLNDLDERLSARLAQLSESERATIITFLRGVTNDVSGTIDRE